MQKDTMQSFHFHQQATLRIVWWGGGQQENDFQSDHTTKVTINHNYITIHLTFKSTVPIVMLPLIICLIYVLHNQEYKMSRKSKVTQLNIQTNDNYR